MAAFYPTRNSLGVHPNFFLNTFKNVSYAPHGANIENASIIKKNVSVPVTVVGGINSPEQAEEAIASGKVDMDFRQLSLLQIEDIKLYFVKNQMFLEALLISQTIQTTRLTSANDFTQLGKSTIVLGGGLVGCEAAADYIEHGVETIIVEMKECLMSEVTGLYRTAVHDFIDSNGGKYKVNARVVKVGKDFVIAQQDGQEITLKADSVVNAMGRRAHNVGELKAAIKVPVWQIGDCVRARQIGDSVREAWTAAMEIV